MKKKLLLVTILSFILVLAACSGGSDDEQSASGDTEYLIRLPHIVTTDHPAHEAAVNFKEEVEKLSDGRIEVQIFPNGELYGSDREIIEALQLNNVEMSLVGTPSLGNFDERFYVLDLPFLFEDREAPRKALAGELGEELAKGIEEINLKALGWGYDGFRHTLNSKHPIEKLEDFKGLKMRVQESELQESIFNALGANASPLAYGELYSALQQNIYDGMDSPFSIIDSGKFYEVQEYLSLTSHQYSGLIILMSLDFFNELPEDLQDAVVTASKNIEEEYYQMVDESEDTLLEELKEKMEVNEISPEEREKFVEAVQPVYEQFRDVVGEDLIELAKSANE